MCVDAQNSISFGSAGLWLRIKTSAVISIEKYPGTCDQGCLQSAALALEGLMFTCLIMVLMQSIMT